MGGEGGKKEGDRGGELEGEGNREEEGRGKAGRRQVGMKVGRQQEGRKGLSIGLHVPMLYKERVVARLSSKSTLSPSNMKHSVDPFSLYLVSLEV